MEETVRRITPDTSLRSVLCQQVVFEEREETEIVSSPRAYIIEGESSEFFEVPEPRRKLGIFPSVRASRKARNLSENWSQGKARGNNDYSISHYIITIISIRKIIWTYLFFDYRYAKLANFQSCPTWQLYNSRTIDTSSCQRAFCFHFVISNTLYNKINRGIEIIAHSLNSYHSNLQVFPSFFTS